jgi:hypothetical protein
MTIKLKYRIRYIFALFICVLAFTSFNTFLACQNFRKNYTRKDAIENFNKNEKGIMELVAYFRLNTPENKVVAFSLGKKTNQFNIGVAPPEGLVDRENPNIGGRNMALNSNELNFVLSKLYWSNQILDTLTIKIKKTGCIGILSGDPIRVDFQYSRYGLFTYYIFNKNLDDSAVNMYNYELRDTVIRKNAVLIFKSGL